MANAVKDQQEIVPNESPVTENADSDAKKSSEEAPDSTGQTDESQSNNDPYAYLERNGFTSEKFKIEVRNLPKYYGLSELKKLLNTKLKLGTNKIKTPSKGNFLIYVCFRSEEDKAKAIKVLHGFVWKGNVLSAAEASAIPDPLVKKRMQENDDNSKKKLKVDNVSVAEMLKDAVTPLWRIPYKEQLTLKEEAMADFLKSLGNQLIKVNPQIAKHIIAQQKKYNGLPCELWPLRHAELTNDGYRNKCEFTIGINESTGLKTIGFRLGTYANGSLSVAPIEEALNVPRRMKHAVSLFQNFVRNSEYDVYHPETQEGCWRQLTVRYGFRSDQIMLIVGINPYNMEESQFPPLFDQIKQFFTEGEGKRCVVASLWVHIMEKKKSQDDEPRYHHLMGKTYICERILSCKFRISPQAFFQINVPATEILYDTIAELANLDDNVTLLDICCGTGSIGICLSEKCGEVLGLEVSPQAVEDAKRNAEANKITEARFFVGKAEDILTSVMFRANKESIVAIADPPRAGLHQSAVVQLRRASNINKLVYVSCEPKLAVKNFVDLCRAPSKTYQRGPFVPVRAVPVDLFPHTKHCELLIFFERIHIRKCQTVE